MYTYTAARLPYLLNVSTYSLQMCVYTKIYFVEKFNT